MAKQNDPLSAFMKKQISEKSTKKTIAAQKNSSNSHQDQKKDKKIESDSEELSEEEQLKEAKKLSANKAAQRNQTEMVKKLIIENIVKYLVIISVMIILAFSVIKSGPAIVQFFDGIISKIIFGAISKH